MFANVRPPHSYSLITQGNVSLLLRDDYRELLLREGLADIGAFLKRNEPTSRYVMGRTAHPSIFLGNSPGIVVRRYTHGGLFGFLLRDLYIRGSRSFSELALTEEIRSSGIQTVQPIGAIHQFVVWPLYRAFLLTTEVTRAMDLSTYLAKAASHRSSETLASKRKILRASGILLRQFHGAGFYHRDLQLKNILVSEDQPLLIDFDRSYRKQNLSSKERLDNLLRLNRSADKWGRKGLRISRTDRWRFFLAYAADDVSLREALRKAWRAYRVHIFVHRIGWALRGE